ncbi:hypothetical protein CH381_13490 [Leptospira sp. mixed culture ATI2-C-A1]|nr:hypothetical protein CH381_13490 [Leptospira sp. mixed culture ATI2-C-A1]
MFHLFKNPYGVRIPQRNIILFFLFSSISLFQPVLSQSATELYEDKDTGQIFTKPGNNRVKIDKFPSVPDDRTNKTNHNVTTLPDAFAHRPDDVSKEKLTITGRVQFRGASGTAQSPLSNGHRDFNTIDYAFRRLRLGAMYENDWWGASIQLRLENMLNRVDLSQTTQTVNYTDASGRPGSVNVVTNERLKDNRGYIQEAVIYTKLPYAGGRITLGQINVPFNREYIGSSANLVSLERSMVTAALPQFDNGIMLQATPLKEIHPKYERYLHLSFMVGNGKGGGGDYGTGRRQDLTTSNRYGFVNISPTYYGRVVWNVFGSLKRESDGREVNWQEGEEIFQRDMKLSLGSAFQQTQNLVTPAVSAMEYNAGTTNGIAFVTPQGVNGYPSADGGSSTLGYNTQNGGTTPGRTKMGLIAHTYDATFTWSGFYFNAAYTKMSGPASNGLIGWHTTFGYNIPITNKFYLMPIFKYDQLMGDFNRNGNRHDPNETLRIYWIGLNLFGDKHHYKVQLYYEILANKLDRDVNTGSPMLIDDRRIYLQVQSNFWTGTTSPESYGYRSN